MKSSAVLAISGAALAMAGPLNLFKREMETSLVIDFCDRHRYRGSTTPTPTPTPTPEPAPPAPETTTVAPAADPVVEAPTVVVPAPAPVSTQQAQPAAPSDYSSTVVYHHNVHRLNHSAPTLTFDDTYAGYAANTAKNCVFAHDMHQGAADYGQNLAVWGSTDVNSIDATTAAAQAISDMWYKEMASYPGYGGNPDMGNFRAWGHFSQMVWADSTTTGCYTQLCRAGTIYDDMDSWFTVCNYKPVGNVANGYAANVKAPLGQAGVSA